MRNGNQTVPLKQAVVELFQAEQLDPARLRALREIGPKPAMLQRRRMLALAASVVAVGGLALLLSRRETHAEQLLMLAEEVAYAHLLHSNAADGTLDALGNNIAALRPTFATVGFALIDATADPALQGAELIGGRFCSISAAAAVQLRYRNASGEISVCQTRFNPLRHDEVPDLAVAGSAPAVLHARGVRVSLAHRQGVLFGVAVAA